MKCKICGDEGKHIFNAKILNKYDIEYFRCEKCFFVQVEEPYWLDEAYSRSINITDTGYMQRNLSYSKKLTILLFFMFDRDGHYLDYAGGYGAFVRIMRDIGFDFYWDDKYTENIFASGFEWNELIKINAVTAFEAFEHFVDPIVEIERLLSISDSLIFTTELLPAIVPNPEEWWYYGLEHGQHISFYSSKTFEYIAEKYDLNYFNLGSLHVLSKRSGGDYYLLISKLSKFGLHKILKRFLKSKTMSDYYQMIKVKNNENSI